MSKENVEKTTEVASEQTSSEEFKKFLKEVQDFALTVGEECPEGHRREAGSNRCVPMGSIDHTKESRSVNVDYGPEWRGLAEEEDNTEVAVDADEMDQLESCAEGTTFSFVQRRCITPEEAELEDADEAPLSEEGQGHEEVVALDPEGRRDTVNFECPANEFFDHKRRECIPLNKDTVMASENEEFSEEFKKAVARFGKVAKTAPDPLDGHRHHVTVNEDGDGMTSVDVGYAEKGYSHSHEVVEFEVAPYEKEDYVSRHPGPVNPWVEDDHDSTVESVPYGSASEEKEDGAKITTKQRKALPSASFGVPGKRKFPLDTCGRVRNAMARFNQAKGLTAAEKATLRRKILAAAKKCGIEVRKFAKAQTEIEFAEVLQDLLAEVKPADVKPAEEARLEAYHAEEAQKQGPCPTGMVWDTAAKRCKQARGFVESLKDEAQHSDIVQHQPEGRRDPVGFQCPDGWFFDFTDRKCLPLDPSQKPGTTTTKAEEEEEEEGAQRDLAPSPAGKPARLPQDCPEGTIWSKDKEDCVPLDSRKKTKSEEEEEAAIPPQFLKNIKKKKKGKNGDDEKQQTKKDCGPEEFFNPVLKKCMPRKGAFKKGKGETEEAVNAQPANREGLTDEVPGKVKHPTDCPPGTAWDGTRKTCTPLSTMEKNRPVGSPGPMDPMDVASVESLSLAQLIQKLDEIIKTEVVAGRGKEKARVAAKDLPNAAFPPSLVGPTKRGLMHHEPTVKDPYDHESVDVGRLRNALARTSVVEGFSEQAAEDAREHLLYHARAVVVGRLSKKD
jgi:hypothetical protein